MQRRKQDIILLCVSIGSFLLMALSFLVMPLKMPNIEPRILNIIIGSMFWGFLIIGVAVQVILAQRRKTWIRRNHLRRNRNFLYSKVGVLAFAQNIFGCIADAILGLSSISLIIALVLTRSAGYICYVALAVLVFAFCLHCILNGKIFYYVQNQDKILSEREREQQSKQEKENETWLISKIH